MQFQLWLKTIQRMKDVYISLQGLDEDGFERFEIYLSGNIPIGSSKILTTKENIEKELFDKIVKWQSH